MANAASELRTDHLMAGLGARSARGGVIVGSAQALKLVLQIATVIVLTRLLPPTAFGLIAMVAAISTLFDLVKELGLSVPTIRKPDLTHAEVTALFWVNTAAGALITGLLMLAAPAIAAFYGQPSLVAVTRWLSLGFLVSGLTVQHWALLRRQMRFTAAVAVDTSGDLGSFAVAIVLAHFGAGYWALVAQRLVAPLLVLIGSWTLCAWRPGLPRRTAGIGELMRFGVAVTGVNVAAAFSRSIDQILVGRFWGAATLGLYERAVKLLLTPVNNIGTTVYAVGMPGLSRVEHETDRYRRGFCGLLEKLAMILVPAALFASISADWLVYVLFGPRWQAATPLVACFAIAGAYLPMIQALGLLYLTQNRSRDMVWASALDTSLCVAAVLVGLPFGAVAVAASLAIVGTILRAPFAFWLSSRRGPVRLADITRAVLPSITAGLCGVGAVAALREGVLDSSSLPAVAKLALAALIAFAVIIAAFCVIPQSRHALSDLRVMAKQLLGPIPSLRH